MTSFSYFKIALSPIIIGLFISILPYCVHSGPVMKKVSTTNGIASMSVPDNWKIYRDMRNFRRFHLDIEYFGKDSIIGCFVETKYNSPSRNESKLSILYETESIKSKNPGADIIFSSLDSIHRKIIIDYKNKLYYFRYIRFMNHDKEIIFNFRGIYNYEYLSLFDSITQSIDIKNTNQIK